MLVRNDITVDDLRKAIAASEEEDYELVVAVGGSPFTHEVCEAPLLEGFKLPKIKAYEEEVDPQDYFDHFNDLMELQMVSDLTTCRVFTVTLSNNAKTWLRSLKPSSI